jgi:hypothetical protein
MFFFTSELAEVVLEEGGVLAETRARLHFDDVARNVVVDVDQNVPLTNLAQPLSGAVIFMSSALQV